MSLEERIAAAVTPIVAEFAVDVYTGDAQEYCVCNATEIPGAFGDGRPRAVRYLVQLHWYFPPRRRDPRDVKRRLRAALGGLRGCTWPTVEDASDREGGHLVFEFEAVDGDV